MGQKQPLADADMPRRVSSYPSIFAAGHKALEGLLGEPVLVEEKVDGSQFSFGIVGGALCARSKGKQLILDAPEPLFAPAVETIKRLVDRLVPDWIYRAEFLGKPKHNTMAYERIPVQHLILYDIMTNPEDYAPRFTLEATARSLGLEVVPCYFEGRMDTYATVQPYLTATSVLGGPVEGVVIKSRVLFGKDKKPLMAKVVRTEFQEMHHREWKKTNPTRKDVVAELIDELAVEARWLKAVQHLREAGRIQGTPQDIGLLLTAIADDVRAETEDYIKDRLFQHSWPDILRGIRRGIPQWYKQHLMDRADDGTA